MAKEFGYVFADFTSLGANDIDFGQLHHEVETSSIADNLLRIREEQDGNVEFKFQTDLSGADETTLDGIVVDHDGSGLNVEEQATPDSEGESSTTGTTYLTKLSYSVGTLEGGVKYRIGWYCEVNTANIATRCQVQVSYDSTVIALTSVEIEDTLDWIPFSGFFYLPADTSVSAITIKYRRQGTSGYSAKIRRARLELTKEQ